jgi:hypothetical protein
VASFLGGHRGFEARNDKDYGNFIEDWVADSLWDE